MTTTKYSNKTKKLPQDLKAPSLRTIFFEFLWGTSAEAYMTYFIFNRCTTNLCVRPSTNALDSISSQCSFSIRGQVLSGTSCKKVTVCMFCLRETESMAVTLDFSQ